MFSLIKQVFIVLLRFSSSLARDQTKGLLLYDNYAWLDLTHLAYDVLATSHLDLI